MKKTVYLAAAAFAMLGMAACTGKEKSSTPDLEDMTYTGVLPAADCDGIRYTVKLDYDDDKNNMEGDYDLIETYLQADTTSNDSIRKDISYKSEGDFTVMEQGGKKYLKLIKDNKDSNPKAIDTLYFLVENDSTLTWVNSDLQVAPSDSLNYSLKLVK